MRIGKGKVVSETRQVSKVFYSTPIQKNVERQMTQCDFSKGVSYHLISLMAKAISSPIFPFSISPTR